MQRSHRPGPNRRCRLVRMRFVHPDPSDLHVCPTRGVAIPPVRHVAQRWRPLRSLRRHSGATFRLRPLAEGDPVTTGVPLTCIWPVPTARSPLPERTLYRITGLIAAFLFAVVLLLAWGALRDTASAQTAPVAPPAIDAEQGSIRASWATGLPSVATIEVPTSLRVDERAHRRGGFRPAGPDARRGRAGAGSGGRADGNCSGRCHGAEPPA